MNTRSTTTLPNAFKAQSPLVENLILFVREQPFDKDVLLGLDTNQEETYDFSQIMVELENISISDRVYLRDFLADRITRKGHFSAHAISKKDIALDTATITTLGGAVVNPLVGAAALVVGAAAAWNGYKNQTHHQEVLKIRATQLLASLDSKFPNDPILEKEKSSYGLLNWFASKQHKPHLTKESSNTNLYDDPEILQDSDYRPFNQYNS